MFAAPKRENNRPSLVDRDERPSFQQLHQLAQERPVVYLLTYWAVDEGVLHAWAVPEDVAFDAFSRLPTNARSDSKTVGNLA